MLISKKTIFLAAVCGLVVSMSSAAYFVYDKITDMQRTIAGLLSEKRALVKGNKDLRKSNSSLSKRNQGLQHRNGQLAERNKGLRTKITKTKEKVISRNRSVVTRKMQRAGRKLAAVPARMLPFAGTAVVVTFTAYEINELCKDVDEINEFESSLFGADNENLPLGEHDSGSICGVDIEKDLMPVAEKQTRDAMASVSDEFCTGADGRCQKGIE